jgi:DNA-binding beta-propeller fold protein YncE
MLTRHTAVGGAKEAWMAESFRISTGLSKASLLVSGALIAGGVAACDPPPATPDAAVAADDAFTPPMADAFVPPGEDAGMMEMPDAFMEPADAFAPPPDAFMLDAFVPPRPARTAPTNGSAIVLSQDDAVAVATNRQAGTISVFNVTASGTPSLSRTALIDVAGLEPWAAVIGNDDSTAFVVLRESHQVARIRNLRTTPVMDVARVDTGSEPTGIAISPNGRFLYVPCWAEGTVTVIDAVLFTVSRTIDLNDDLVATGDLGTVTARPGLAHPRAIVVTNDGDTDDSDETVWVTEYFGQHRTSGLPADDSAFDVAKEGIVYRFGAEGGAAMDPVRIAPVTDTGFVDSNGATTGCFPNQLQTAALSQGRLYLTGVCASPRGPTGPVIDMATGLPVAEARGTANFKTEVHTTIFVVDAATAAELPAQRVLLPRAFQTRYDMASPAVPDDATRRIPLIASDLAFVPASGIGYLTSYGSDAVFRVSFNADGTLREVGATAAHFINLAPSGMPAGRLPMGIAIANAGSGLALTINETTRNVSMITLSTQAVVGATEATTVPAADSTEAHLLDGRRFFVTGLGRWSFRGQGWNSCEACHGDGLTDNVTWFFARGPRQSTSLDGSYDSADPTQRRVFNWTAIFDEMHDFELNTRGNSGGIGAVVDSVSSPAAVADRIHFDGSAPTPRGPDGHHDPAGGPQRRRDVDDAGRLEPGPLDARGLGSHRRVGAHGSLAARARGPRRRGRDGWPHALRDEQLRGLPRHDDVDQLARLLHAERGQQRRRGPAPHDELHGARHVPGGAQPAHRDGHPHRLAPLPGGRDGRRERPDPVRAARRRDLPRLGHHADPPERLARRHPRGAHEHDDRRAGPERLQPALAPRWGRRRALLPRRQRAHARGGLRSGVRGALPGAQRELPPLGGSRDAGPPDRRVPPLDRRGHDGRRGADARLLPAALPHVPLSLL